MFGTRIRASALKGKASSVSGFASSFGQSAIDRLELTASELRTNTTGRARDVQCTAQGSDKVEKHLVRL